MALKSPGSEPVLEVLESFETFGATDDLGGVVASEKSIWRLAHLSGGDTEADHGSVNDLVILKRPQVVKLLLLHIFMWGQTENTIGVVSKTLRLIKSQELEECTFILLQIGFKLIWCYLTLRLEWLNASIVLPDEALKLSRSIGQLGGGLGEDLIRLRLVHIVCHGLASLVSLVSLHKTARQWVVLLEFVVTCSLVVAEHTGDGEVLRSGIEDDAGLLCLWRAHMDGTEIHCIVSAIEWDLKLQVIFVVLGGISDLADKLSSVDVRFAALLALLLGLDQVAVVEVLVGLLSQACDLFLSHLPISVTSLQLSELTVVHLVSLDHELLISLRYIRSVNNQIDVRLLR